MLHAPYEPISGIAPFTYALSGAHICIPGENPAEFESLLADITAEMKPTGAATQFLVEEMAQCQWKLRRSTVILRDHYRFLLNITDYKTVGNAFLRDNIGVHSITKLARYDNLLRRAWRECYTLLQNRLRPGTNQPDDAGEPRAQQAGSSNPPSPSETPTRQNSTDFDAQPPFSDLRSPTSDLPSSNSTDFDTQPLSSELRSPNSDLLSSTRHNSTEIDTPRGFPPSQSDTNRQSGRLPDEPHAASTTRLAVPPSSSRPDAPTAFFDLSERQLLDSSAASQEGAVHAFQFDTNRHSGRFHSPSAVAPAPLQPDPTLCPAFSELRPPTSCRPLPDLPPSNPTGGPTVTVTCGKSY